MNIGGLSLSRIAAGSKTEKEKSVDALTAEGMPRAEAQWRVDRVEQLVSQAAGMAMSRRAAWLQADAEFRAAKDQPDEDDLEEDQDGDDKKKNKKKSKANAKDDEGKKNKKSKSKKAKDEGENDDGADDEDDNQLSVAARMILHAGAVARGEKPMRVKPQPQPQGKSVKMTAEAFFAAVRKAEGLEE
jgi:hypothetical protein